MVKTIGQLRAEMQAQMAKTAEGSITPNDVFGLMQDALDTMSGNGEYPRADRSQLTINKSVILALADVQDALGWVAYTTGNNDIAFAAELPTGATYLGGVFEISGSGDNLEVKIFANKDVHDMVYCETWGGFYYDKDNDEVVYLSAIGSYDAEGNRLSEETEGVEGTVFTIKRCDSDTNLFKPEDDADFQADFGTATNAQRQLAMEKLQGFLAAKQCAEFNPDAAKINMAGMWRMPSMLELKEARENALIPSFKYGKQFSSNYWSLLEYSDGNAWYYNLEVGDFNVDYKSNSYCLRAVCVL